MRYVLMSCLQYLFIQSQCLPWLYHRKDNKSFLDEKIKKLKQ